MPHFISDKPAEALMFRCGLALYLAVILIGSIPGARAEVGEVASGLVLHFVTYSCIAFLLAAGGAGSISSRAVKAFCIVVLMGALDEAIQSFLPYRHGALTDWMVDTSAALFVTLTYRIRGNSKTEIV